MKKNTQRENKNNNFSNRTLSPSSARYYNSDLSIWISVDPMADKYPNLSPYTYCADNPVKLVDPEGRIFEVANNEESHRDVLSIVEEQHRQYISFGENGQVAINTEGLSENALKNDIGLSLINDMVVSNKKYYYETSDVALYCNSEGERIASPNYIYPGVINASKYGLDAKNRHTHLPMQGFDGQVVITKSGEFRLQNRDVRKNIVFHELKENYLRTDKNMNYLGPIGIGAHKTAAYIEFQKWNTQGGQADYIMPTLGQKDFEIMYARKNKYMQYGTY